MHLCACSLDLSGRVGFARAGFPKEFDEVGIIGERKEVVMRIDLSYGSG